MLNGADGRKYTKVVDNSKLSTFRYVFFTNIYRKRYITLFFNVIFNVKINVKKKRVFIGSLFFWLFTHLAELLLVLFLYPVAIDLQGDVWRAVSQILTHIHIIESLGKKI